MNILYLLTDALNIGGAQKDILIFAQDYIKRGHKVVVVCRKGALENDLTKLGAKYFNTDFHFHSPVDLSKALKQLKEIIERENIDILAPQSIRTSIMASLANKETRKPIITTIHNVGSWFYSFVSGLILNTTSTFVIFESEYERRRLVRFGLDRNRTIVVHSGIDLEKLRPYPKDKNLLKEIGILPTDMVIGTVARLSPEKGQSYLIKAMSRVVKTNPQAKLIFIGDGQLKQDLIKKVGHWGLEKSIKFLGEQKNIPRYISLLDLFILSSTRESFPLSAREAMAMAKPVIATKVGGCNEIVSDNLTGVLVSPANDKILAKAILKLLDDKPLMLKMGDEARIRAGNLFNKNRWLDTNEKIMLYFSQNDQRRLPSNKLRSSLSSLLYCVKKVSKRKQGIRVLMYHCVNDTHPYDRLSVKVHGFRKQMEFLRNNCDVIDLEDAASQLFTTDKDNIRGEKPKVVLTFDDGFEDSYTNAYPILKEHGFPTTIFLSVNSVGSRGFLNWEQIKEMAQNNITFGAHTLNHVELNKVSLEEARFEINGSKQAIENNGLKCNFLCYPKGSFNQEIKDLARKAGFIAACSIKPATNLPGQDLFELNRTEVSGFDSLFDFKKKLSGAYDLLHKFVQKRNAQCAIRNTKRRINILYVIWSLGLGGAERVVINLAKGLDKSQFNPLICCLNEKGEFANELEDIGIKVIPMHKKGKLDYRLIGKLVNLMREYNIDIVHTHLWGANFWGRIAARLAGVSVIVSTEHNVDYWKNSGHFVIDKILSYFTNKVILVSNSVKDFYKKKAKLSENKLEIIYNGIDVSMKQQSCLSDNLRGEFGIRHSDVILATIGRLVPQKGHHYLFEALYQLDSRYDIKLLVVGDGGFKNSLQSKAHSLQLEDKVVFTGLRKDIPDLLKIIDILVLPSLREGLPIIALEAMAFGVPILATKVGGNPEVIIDGKTGILVEPKDSLEIKQALIRLIEDNDLRKQLGINAKKRVKEEFGITKMLDKTQNLYLSLYRAKNSN